MQDAMKHPELDPSHLFPEDLGVGWWQGRVNMAVGQHTFEGEPFTRFIVIIADAEVFLNRANRVNVYGPT